MGESHAITRFEPLNPTHSRPKVTTWSPLERTMPNGKSQLIATFPLSTPPGDNFAARSLCVRKLPYTGGYFVDVRQFVARNGKQFPTHKGITLRMDHIHDIVEALQRVEGEARAAGLLE